MTFVNIYCHICVLKWKPAIRHLLLISFFGILLQSCVDVLPVPSPSEDKKMFVVCEMTVGKDINAKVSWAGTLDGIKPRPLEVPDTFFFSIVEGDKDFGVKFIYNARDSFFVIRRENLQLRPGENYKFRGAGTNSNTSEPSLIMPSGPVIDSISISEFTTEVVNGKSVTEVVAAVKYRQDNLNPGFFHVIPKSEKKDNWEVVSYEKDFQAYKRMNHKEGLLVDCSRVKDKSLKLRLRMQADYVPEFLYLDLGNATESYYKYNFYLSNTVTDPGQSSENQAIAAFNILTPKAYGSFNAVNFVSFPKKLKG